MGRDQAILDAAEKLFYERSFDGTGVDAIAREAGITGSGVYRHFTSKEDILAALIQQATDALLASLPAPADDPRVELESLVAAHVRFALDHRRLADIWQREHHILQARNRRTLERRQGKYVDRWVEALGGCYPGHTREELVAVVRGLHALISSDTTRRSGSKVPSDLAGLLTGLALAATRSLAG